jgi:hypothetical protein
VLWRLPWSARACSVRRSAARRAVGLRAMEEIGRNPAGSSARGATSCAPTVRRDPAAVASASRSGPSGPPPSSSSATATRRCSNLAFSPGHPWTLLCPRTTRAARARGARGRAAQPPARVRARRVAPQRRLRARPSRRRAAAGPRTEVIELRFGHGDLARCASSRTARDRGGHRGRPRRDLVLAVDELATNKRCATPAARDGCAPGARTARCSWRSPTGHIADPLAGATARGPTGRRPRAVPGQPALRPGAAALRHGRQLDPHPLRIG